jgi:hypothetical protein
MILIPTCYCCLHGNIIKATEEDVKVEKEEKKSEVVEKLEWVEEEKKSEVNDSDFSLIDFSD